MKHTTESIRLNLRPLHLRHLPPEGCAHMVTVASPDRHSEQAANRCRSQHVTAIHVSRRRALWSQCFRLTSLFHSVTSSNHCVSCLHHMVTRPAVALAIGMVNPAIRPATAPAITVSNYVPSSWPLLQLSKDADPPGWDTPPLTPAIRHPNRTCPISPRSPGHLIWGLVPRQRPVRRPLVEQRSIVPV